MACPTKYFLLLSLSTHSPRSFSYLHREVREGLLAGHQKLMRLTRGNVHYIARPQLMPRTALN
jgi:hypothetical protein